MKYWKIENINPNTFLGNEIKRFDVKSYGNIIVTNDKWATGNWSTRVGATEVSKTEAQSILDLHEEKTRKTNQSWIKKPAPVNKSRTTLSADYDIFQDIMNWDYGDAD